MLKYTTRDVPVNRRLQFWSSWASDRMAPMHVESGDHCGRFEGQMTSFDLGPIIASRAYSTAAVIHRAGQHSARFGSRYFVISMPTENGFRMRTAQWERFVPADNFLITDSMQTGMGTHSGCTVHTLRVSEQLFMQYLPDGADLAGVVVPGVRGPGAIAAAMMRSLLPDRPHRFLACSSDHLVVAMMHAIAAALAETAGVRLAPAASAATRRAQIIRYVEANLSDADLNVRSVSKEFGLSDRYVRSLFSGLHEPLSIYIRRRRLEESARQLRDPLFISQTVSDIAFRWGFNSLGSFDRAFRCLYSTTPGSYRQGAITS